MQKNTTCTLPEKYNSDTFKQHGYKIIDILADYLSDATSGSIKEVLPNVTPDEMLNLWDEDISEEGGANFESLIIKAIDYSNHLHSPRYIGHQVAPALPYAVLADAVSAMLSNGAAIYEVGPVNTILETKIIRWMSKLIGYNNNSGGFLTSGGSLGNLTALLTARQAKTGLDIWTDGVDQKSSKLAVLTSEQNHYSIKKAIQIMGLGEHAAISVPTNENYQMTLETITDAYNQGVKDGKKIFAVVASACSTATGSYDALEEIAKFCKEKDIWLHVDGAHGAPALISDKYKSLLKGIEHADSAVWDAHKMMLMPHIITAVIFKDEKNSYKAFSQKASYLFEKDKNGDWANLAHRTMECTKGMMALKLYTSLMVYGSKFFGDYVTQMYDLTKKCAEIIKNSERFELAIEPQSNIICFRYLDQQESDLNLLQNKIRKEILESGHFYIVKATLRGKVYLRCTLINPLTTENTFIELLEEIKKTSKQICLTK